MRSSTASSPSPKAGSLSVEARIEHGRLSVAVADTGLGFGRAATAGAGTGLANIRERLKLLHGDQGCVTVAENSPDGTRVTLVVPYRVQAAAAGNAAGAAIG